MGEKDGPVGGSVSMVGLGDGSLDGEGEGGSVGDAVGTTIVPPRMRIVPVQLPLEKQPSCNVYA